MPLHRLPTALLAAAALVCAAPALAAPDSPNVPPSVAPAPVAPGDQVLQFLHERGLVAKAEGGVIQQARDLASELVLTAANFLGVPYRRGGDNADEGFDCSGFTRHVFEQTIGLVLPRRADQQAQQAGLMNVRRDELRPGDLVFFDTMRRAFSHVGIYIGEGKFIHAPRAGGQVRIEDMRQAYWTKRFNGARRADLAAAAETPRAAP